MGRRKGCCKRGCCKKQASAEGEEKKMKIAEECECKKECDCKEKGCDKCECKEKDKECKKECDCKEKGCDKCEYKKDDKCKKECTCNCGCESCTCKDGKCNCTSEKKCCEKCTCNSNESVLCCKQSFLMTRRKLQNGVSSESKAAMNSLFIYLQKKDGNRWAQYWNLLRKKIQLSVSPRSFESQVIEIIGRENCFTLKTFSQLVYLHNQIIRGMVISSLRRIKVKKLEIRSIKRVKKETEGKGEPVASPTHDEESEEDHLALKSTFVSLLTKRSAIFVESFQCDKGYHGLLSDLSRYCKRPLMPIEKSIFDKDMIPPLSLIRTNITGFNPFDRRPSDLLLGPPINERPPGPGPLMEKQDKVVVRWPLPEQMVSFIYNRKRENGVTDKEWRASSENFFALMHMCLRRETSNHSLLQYDNCSTHYNPSQLCIISPDYVRSFVSSILRSKGMMMTNQAVEGLLMGISVFILRIVIYVSKNAVTIQQGAKNHQAPRQLLIDAHVLKQAVKSCPLFMGPIINTLLDDCICCGDSR